MRIYKQFRLEHFDIEVEISEESTIIRSVQDSATVPYIRYETLIKKEIFFNHMNINKIEKYIIKVIKKSRPNTKFEEEARKLMEKIGKLPCLNET